VKFTELALGGAYLIEPEPIEDHRGFFARAYCRREFAGHGIDIDWVQCNIAYSTHRHTLRGLHYQKPPHGEPKLMRVTSGAAHAVIVDLRPGSPAYLRHAAVGLSAANRYLLFIPEGLAAGYLTLEPETEIFYMMGAFYAPDYSAGFRWDDPAFNINWPAEPQVISPRDANYPDFATQEQVR